LKSTLPNVWKHFVVASPTEVSEMIHGHGLFFDKPLAVSPFTVYSFLKEHFGPARVVWSDRTQWEFLLKAGDVYLAVYDWKLFSWNIGVRTSSEDMSEKLDKAALAKARLLISYILKYAKSKNKTKVPVDEAKYEIIENVFISNYVRGENFLFELEKAHWSEAPEKAWSAAMSFLLSSEALLNIVYELYLNKNLFENVELRQRIDRMSLAEKWCFAHCFCTCFKKPLRRDSKGYSRLKELSEIRNEMVHSKIPESRVYFVRKDGLAFATDEQHIPKDITEDSFSTLLEYVRDVKRKVHEIRDELVASMKPSLKRRFCENVNWQTFSIHRNTRKLAGPRHYWWPS